MRNDHIRNLVLPLFGFNASGWSVRAVVGCRGMRGRCRALFTYILLHVKGDVSMHVSLGLASRGREQQTA
jgi:hypothetical protein